MVKVIWQKGRIAAANERFSGIRHIVPVCTPPNTCFLGLTRVHNPNGISIGSAISAQLMAECRRACPGTSLPLKLMSFPLKLPLSHGDLDLHLIRGSLVPADSASQMASQSVQPFLHRSRQTVIILYSRPTLPPKQLDPSNTWFLDPTRAHNPNGISIGSAVFSGLMTVTDRQTDEQTVRPRYSVCNNRPHLRT